MAKEMAKENQTGPNMGAALMGHQLSREQIIASAALLIKVKPGNVLIHSNDPLQGGHSRIDRVLRGADLHKPLKIGVVISADPPVKQLSLGDIIVFDEACSISLLWDSVTFWIVHEQDWLVRISPAQGLLEEG
jgi:hypothetical protein